MSKVRKGIVSCLILGGLVTVSACQNSTTLKDGTFVGVSQKDENDAYASVTLTIKNQEISDVNFVTYQKDGSIKDEDYGKTAGEITNQEFYNKAQKAVKAMTTYQEQLIETKDIDEVDAISGATISYEQFKEATETALKEAQE